MKARTNQQLAALIAHYATEPATRKQLERLPAFIVPADTDAAFRDLLSRLDHSQTFGLDDRSLAQ